LEFEILGFLMQVFSYAGICFTRRTSGAASKKKLMIVGIRDFGISYAGIFFCRYLFHAADKRGGAQEEIDDRWNL